MEPPPAGSGSYRRYANSAPFPGATAGRTIVKEQLESLVGMMVERGILLEEALTEFEKKFIKHVYRALEWQSLPRRESPRNSSQYPQPQGRRVRFEPRRPPPLTIVRHFHGARWVSQNGNVGRRGRWSSMQSRFLIPSPAIRNRKIVYLMQVTGEAYDFAVPEAAPVPTS